MNKLKEEYDKDHPKILTDEQVMNQISSTENELRTSRSRGGIVVKGIHDVAVRFSKCCNPVPGDEIVGFVTRGRGISIHRTDCINMMGLSETERHRLIDAEWEASEEENKGQLYTTNIKIYAYNRTGIIMDVSKVFLEMNIDMTSVNVNTSKNGRATLSISFDIFGVEQLNKVIARLRNIDSVIDIERTIG
jgi:GTP pyrophosphokinase